MSSDVDDANVEGFCVELREAIRRAVNSNMADAILISGGLDTSIVAKLASSRTRPYGLTVALAGAPNPDLPYAMMLAEHLGIRHKVHHFGEDELFAALRKVTLVLHTYDPMEVRNSAAIQVGLQVLKQEGFNSVMTGDGGDELFAGYSFFFQMGDKELQAALEKMWVGMHFSSIELGRHLEIHVRTPLLHEEVMELAKRIPVSLKVRSEGGQVYGKWILRKAFMGLVPDKILWRKKDPIEVGTGTTTLPKFFEKRIQSSEFERRRKAIYESDGIKVRDPEHLSYYEFFKEIFGCPTPATDGQRPCSGCGSSVPPMATFCKICGAYPA